VLHHLPLCTPRRAHESDEKGATRNTSRDIDKYWWTQKRCPFGTFCAAWPSNLGDPDQQRASCQRRALLERNELPSRALAPIRYKEFKYIEPSRVSLVQYRHCATIPAVAGMRDSTPQTRESHFCGLESGATAGCLAVGMMLGNSGFHLMR
jgi:hypothetical protein